MPARSPEELFDLFVDDFARGDADAAAALYDSAGVMSQAPGQVVRGRTAILDTLKTALADKPKFTLHEKQVVRAGDLALLTSRWTISVPSPSGPTETTVRPTVVARREPDGHWLVVIDSPNPA